MSELTLKQKFDARSEDGILEEQYPAIPAYITENLASKISLRPYQDEGLRRFLYYINGYKQRAKPAHLLYHMATGSGKTVVMASLIIELYSKGYRNFMFFVNSTNIIKKTKENFINPQSSKYLFAEKLSIDGKEIKIKEVDNFEAVNGDDINIHFTTIQGLHSRIITPKENSITIEDFEGKKIVLISDEAHHINAETKKSLGKEEKEEKESWESTIQKIFTQSVDNLLLEFTATVDLEHSAIKEKYKDKIIYEYSLRQFRKDKYSKEVNVIEVDSAPIQRAFQAVLLSQYRRKIAERYGLNIKPVILLKSKNIEPSREFRREFHAFIEALEPKHINEARQSLTVNPFTKIFKYFDDNKISAENLITELKNDFAESKTIDINDGKELESNQIKVNSLEDKDNEIRVVFAVDKLNEGWDVLNLYDIVRLYDTRDSKAGKAGKTTISEAQLIGRGARYYPFKLDSEQEAAKRKYDEDLNNELKILEELYYHAPKIPKYIDEIKEALRQTGIFEDDRIERELIIKNSFKETKFWKTGYIFLNKKLPVDRSNFYDLKQLKVDRIFKHALRTGEISGSVLFDDKKESGNNKKVVSKIVKLGDFEKSIIRFAFDSLSFYKLNSISEYLPKINAVRYFIDREELLAGVQVDVYGNEVDVENLSNRQKLEIVIGVLNDLEQDIKSNNLEHEGTKDFKPYLISEKVINKTLRFSKSNSEEKEFGISMSESSKREFNCIELKNLDWYVYNDCFGTSEEKYFVKYINDNESKIKKIYEEFYLIRNEKLFTIYSFEGGKPFEPDFVLFLRKRNSSKDLVYQVFVEPKGQQLEEKDSWKQDFLQQIDFESLFHGEDYHIKGLPFFNEARKQDFDEACKNLLHLN